MNQQVRISSDTHVTSDATNLRGGLTLPALFEKQVQETPGAMAVAFGQSSLTYAELERRANRIAHLLIARGIGPEDIVALALPRSLDMVVTLLGILKSGAAYMPVDADYPAERIAYMLQDARPALLVGMRDTAQRLANGRPALYLDDSATATELAGASTVAPSDAQRNQALLLDNCAYVIYTSGSTGKPKGVMVPHAGIANLAASQIARFAITAESRILQFASISFDAAVSELCIALHAGACLVLASPSDMLPGDALANLVATAGITHATLPPSALAVMPRDSLPPGFTLIVAGEACPPHLVGQWSAGRRMINAYGPTETTVCATMTQALSGAIAPPLGDAVDNMQVHVLDDLLQPVATGNPGELCIGGIGVARGYLGQPGLTAERFVPDPFGLPGQRMYRTGDLARRDADGALEFLGRIDHQIKVRGFRIEPGEIEAALCRHPEVAQAAVIARADHLGQQQLVAYVVAHDGTAPASAALRRHVADSLPDYMVPAAVVGLAALPQTPNGKLDRQALPAPDFSSGEQRRAETAQEKTIAGLFAEVLGIEDFGAEESFFDLGGHSLAATRLLSRIRSAFGVKLELEDIFDTPSVASLATRFSQAAPTQPKAQEIPRVERSATSALPLSFSQLRMWLLHQLEPDSPFYNMPGIVRLSGTLQVEVLQRCVDDIVLRHEALRTIFALSDDAPVQRIAAPYRLNLLQADLRGLPAAEREVEAARIADREKRTAFDLGTGPLMRLKLVRTDEQQHILVMTVHHTVADGWSMGLLVGEIATLYGAFASGKPSPLPELPIQYADYSAWQRQRVSGELLAQQLDYWKQKMAGAPALLELPVDRPRAASKMALSSRHLDRLLPAHLTERLKAISLERNTTLFAGMLAVLNIVLQRWSARTDLVVGTVIAGRTSEVLEPMIGCFINFLPLRVPCLPQDTPRTLLDKLAPVVREAYAHQDAPFEKIIEAVNPRRAPNTNPLFNVGFLLQNFPEAAATEGGLKVEMLPVTQDTASLDLRFVAQELAQGMHLSCEYRTDLFDPASIEMVLEAFQAVLAQCLENLDKPISELALPPALAQAVEEAHQRPALQAEPVTAKPRLIVSASFTAEPIADSLGFWAGQLAMPCAVEFAPYNQILQSLLDPHSLFCINRDGANLVLLRVEDWLRHLDPHCPFEQRAAILHGSAAEFTAAVEAASRDSAVPLLVCLCPSSAALLDSDDYRRVIAQIRQTIAGALAGVTGVHVIDEAELMRLYPVAAYDDPHGDELGHIPYSTEMFAALGTLLMRKWTALRARPSKVVVLDCDNTLWRGVCGEAGPNGVTITPAHAALQRFMLKQFDAGMLLCLASKNEPADVAAVFAQNPGMLLNDAHIISSRINWAPKSRNLHALAAELQLGIDSFIFIDDNPVECAEVEANCPGVLVLQLPENEAEIPAFLDHIWAFDRLAVTADAQKRTRQYRENREREAVRSSTSSFEDFLASLQLDVSVQGVGSTQLERAAELTQRTNQFNLRPQPRQAMEMQALDNILVVEVKDRFGDYGLTGVVIYQVRGPVLEIDTLLLSCRILGRGVEHRVMAHLGRIAREAGCETIVLPSIDSGRNRPMLDFLAAIATPVAAPNGAGLHYTLTAEQAQHLKPAQSAAVAAEDTPKNPVASTPPLLPAALVRRISTELNSAHKILLQTEAAALQFQEMPQGGTVAMTPTEHTLATIWAQVLKREYVGVEEDFFALGGHSLLATQAVSKIRHAFNADFLLKAIFETPTVKAFAQRIELLQASGKINLQTIPQTIGKVPHDGGLPLSFAQQRLWFLEQLEGDSGLYNIPVALRLTGELDIAALQRTFNEIVRRHAVLRTSFAAVDGTAHQHIAPALEIALTVVDLTGLPHAEREAKAQWLAQDEAQKPFDLTAGPLLRVGLLRLRGSEHGSKCESEHLLLLTIHHIVSDGWSMSILVRETAALYAAFLHGQPSPLPELAIQYADFAHWQRQWLSGEVLQQQLAYWSTKLQGLPGLLALPTDRPRPAVQGYRGATCSFAVPAVTVAALQRISLREQGTLFMTLVAAFNVLLARYSGQEDICIGTPIANRNRAEIEPLVGFFVNTLVLRTQVDGNVPFTELLRQVRTTALDAYAHQDVPFEQLVDALKPERHVSHSPLFQVMFILQNAGDIELRLPNLELQRADAPSTISKFDLTLTMREQGAAMEAVFEYNIDLFEAETMERMAGHFTTLLDAIATAPETCSAALNMVGPDELHTLLHRFNDSAAAYPANERVHTLFERQVSQTPDAVALIAGDVRMTYRQLNQRANRLAHYLRAIGLGGDTLAAICIDRTAEMVIALLGVLKAGGAYIPLDPAYPRDRLDYMLADAKPRVLLTQESLSGFLSTAGMEQLRLDADWPMLEGYPETNPGHPVHRTNLAYVIYTSGSTGKPKGVAVTHASLTNFLVTMKRKPGIESRDVLLSVTSLSFDIAALELFLPLAYGAKIVLAAREAAANPAQLCALIERHAVSMMQATPSTWRMLIDHGWPIRQPAFKVLCGGEALPADLSHQMLQHIPVIWNMYGPTETTIWSSVRCISLADPDISIGRPIANTQFRILDNQFNPVPIGVAGELYIGGDGLARGYLHRPDLSADRFLPDPFADRPGARMYRTGDLARYLADGNVEYLSRIDGQVKIRGFRIEVGEIEVALTQLQQVHQAVVMARHGANGVANDKRLVAYLVLEDGSEQADVSALRQGLLQSLPDYMVPTHFVAMRAFPQTPNGKIDRNALPEPEVTRVETGYVAPRGIIETGIAAIWADLLKLDRVGAHDNFFALGGHSLLATLMFAKLRAVFQAELPLRVIFEAPELALLAQRVELAMPASANAANEGAAHAPALASAPAPGRWIALDRNLSKLEGDSPTAGNMLLIPGAGNGADIYHSIAQALNAQGLNVYLIHHDGVDTDAAPQTSIADMLENYLPQVRRHCQGDFLIGGYCIGGTMSFEMILALRGTAFRPSGLILLDGAIPSADFIAELARQDQATFDENEHMRGFFRAICAIYSREAEPITGDHFLAMSEEQCIVRTVASMKLAKAEEAAGWKDILRKRYRAERAHTMAIHSYWNARAQETPASLGQGGCALAVFQSEEIHRATPADVTALKASGFEAVSVEVLSGKHEGFVLRHHETITQQLLHWIGQSAASLHVL